MSTGSGVAKQLPEAPDTSCAVDVHIAEYEALMSRNTYWITIQFSTAPAIALYFTLLATAWNAITYFHLVDAVVLRKLVLWIGILGAECFVVAGYMCLYEIYSNVRYIESHLRPALDKLLASPNYWMYEKYLAKHRGTGALANEWWAVGFTSVAFVAIAAYARPWNWQDILWLVANLVVLLAVVSRAAEVSKMRLSGFQNDGKQLGK
jgi:hypothetical protein